MFYAPRVSSMDGAAAEAAADRSKAERMRAEVDAFRHDIERLLMISQALWEILKEKHGYTDAELFRRVTEIDLRDGRADGKVAPTETPVCPSCGRRSAKHRPICLYCGKPVLTDPFQR